MNVQRLLAAALLSLPFSGLPACAQTDGQQSAQPNPQQTAPPSATPTEPGTRSATVTPASKAPTPVQAPDVRLDSKPHTDIDYSVDSSSIPPDPGLGASKQMDLGHDIVPVTPPGMLSRSEQGNPRMVYFALPHRSGDEISASDKTIIAAREHDLQRAAAYRGFDLKQSGWMYQQGVCPAMERDAESVVGVPAADGGSGFIVLHFVRHDAESRVSAFTAIVPREAALPVRAVSVVHHGVEQAREYLSKKTSGSVVNEALPPATLYANMQPEQGWIPASACIAEMGGAYPHIPNEPYLSETITVAPPPMVELLLNGERKITFTDQINDSYYSVWGEHIGSRGRMLDANHKVIKIIPRPVTNPPVPQPRLIADVPQPPSRITPPAPSPISGDKQ